MNTKTISLGPFADRCDIQPMPTRDGVEVELMPHLLNSKGQGHGGLLMTLLDEALGMAAKPAGSDIVRLSTVDMSIHFIRPAKGRITCKGRLLRSGGSLAFCEGEVYDENNQVLAKGVATFKLYRE